MGTPCARLNKLEQPRRPNVALLCLLSLGSIYLLCSSKGPDLYSLAEVDSREQQEAW